MSEETTKDQDGRSFEEKVLASVNSMLVTLTSFDSRLATLETHLERQALETKPMWEKALAEIVETRTEMIQRFDNLERKLDVINKDMLQLRADQRHAESRLDKLERGGGEMLEVM
ncbi:MAG TPA: hypothetical protein VGC91_20270 [Pyrinomonadaceae bacterium]|jgi:hypothetical protein